ncbi:MAG TPA: FHA domain-containing protein [Myxococcaceae bacterium]|jgi:pSer/pThr/pTyr-binding forkhead associated (FHA) protein
MRSVGPRSAAAGIRLVCTAGPKSGQEFPLVQQEVVIGRATDNAISVPDTSVSRKHLKLRKTTSGWVAMDLGSGNGTLLNGELIADETVLGNGDVLALGDTEFTFVDEDNATDRREAPVRRPRSEGVPLRRAGGRDGERVRSRASDPAARKKKRGGGGAMLVVAVLAALVCVSLAGLKIYSERKYAAQRRAEEEILAVRQAIAGVFQEGKNLVRQGRWADAKAKFEEVAKADPDYPMVQDYLGRASREIPNQVQLNTAEAALKENKLRDAIAALAKVSADTQQFEKQKELKDQIEKLHKSRMEQAEETMKLAARVAICNPPPGGHADASKYEEVVAITEDILQAFPDDRDAKTLNDDATEKVKTCDKPAAPVRDNRPRGKDSDDAVRLFTDGEIASALQSAQACASRSADCRQKAALIAEFNQLYKKVDDLEGKGLQQLLSLDRRITGGGASKLGRGAGVKAANVFYRTAAAAKTTGSWARASEYAERALQSDPNHAGARALVEEMRSKAKDLYLQGYSNKGTDPDDAAAKFKDVIAMTPASDEWHKKAQARLDEMGK